MASESPSQRLQLEVTCPICLDYFTDPVVLDCGHSFCQACVARCWKDPGAGTTCPQCRMAVGQNFRPNRLLANMGEIYRQMSWSTLQEVQGRRVDCERHQFPLGFFCQDDNTPVCLLCHRSKEHVGHQVVPLRQLAQEYEAKGMKTKKRKSGNRRKKACPVEAPWWSVEGNRSDVSPLLEQVMEEKQEEKPDQHFQVDQPSEEGHDGFAILKKKKQRKRYRHHTRDKALEGEGPSTLCNTNSDYGVCKVEEDLNDEDKDIILPPVGSTSIQSRLVDLAGGSEDAVSVTTHHPASSLGRILKELAGQPVQSCSKQGQLETQCFLPDLPLLPFKCNPPKMKSTSKSDLRGSEKDRRRRRTSYVWKYFTHLNNNRLLAVCSVCRSRVRLGREGGCQRVGTSSMRRHIECRHPQLVPKGDSRATPTLKKSRPERSAVKPAEQFEGQGSLQNGVVSGKQMTIPETWTFKEKHARDSVKSTKLNRALAMFVACSMLPLSVVEDEAFLEFMEELDSRWDVPSRLHLCNNLFPALEKDIKGELLKDLSNAGAGAVHLAGAIWTSKQTKAYLCVAAHWISMAEETLERKSATLAVRLLSDLCHAPNIACTLKSVVSEWLTPLSLEVGCVSTNNSLDLLKAVQQSGMDHVLCITHCLNLVLLKALRTAPPGVKHILNLARTLSVHFRQSWAATEAIRVIQCQHGLPEHRFILDVNTCWESALRMLARLCEQKLAINDYVESQGGLLGFSVGPDHWSIMQDLVDLLKFFSEFVAIFQSERATFGKVLPMLQFLEASVKKSGMEMARKAGGMTQNLNPAVEFAHHLVAQLKSSKHLASIRQDNRYLAATFLEPQIRCSVRAKLVNAVDRPFSTLREYLLQKCLHYHEKGHCFFPLGARQGTSEAASQTEAPAFIKQENGNAWSHTFKAKSRYTKWLLDFGICTTDDGEDLVPVGGLPQQDAYSLVRWELDAYIRDSFSGKVSCPENNPLLYWKAKITAWPSLARVALWHLSCPPSGVASKRVFSTARNVVPKLRTSLTPTSVSTMAFIRANKLWIPKQGRPSPANHEVSVMPDDGGDPDSEEEMILLEEDTEGEDGRDEIVVKVKVSIHVNQLTAMAAKSYLQNLYNEATCPLCRDYFKYPVTTECGHNFCQACLTQCWGESATEGFCPLCRQNVQQTCLIPSRVLANIAEKLAAEESNLQEGREAEGKLSICEKHQEPFKLFCRDDETLICLVCDRSKEHRDHEVVPMEEASEYKDRMVSCLDNLKNREGNIVEELAAEESNLQEGREAEGKPRICEKHQEPFRLFCRDDETLVCLVCDRSKEHRHHDVVPMEEASDEYKDRMVSCLDSLKNRKAKILSSEADVANESQNMLKRIEIMSQDTKAEVEELCQILDTEQKVLLGSLEEQKMEISRKSKEQLDRLSEKRSSLEHLIQEMEEKCQRPPSELLQDVRSTLNRCEKKEDTKDPVASLCQLNWGIWTTWSEISLLKSVRKQVQDMLLKGIHLSKASVTLDPKTAHPRLIISKDHRHVKVQEARQDLPNNPERFDQFPIVLGMEKFSSGRHYWDVLVGPEVQWAVGVAKASVRRKGAVAFGAVEGIWVIGNWSYGYLAPNHPDYDLVPAKRNLKKIKVLLNYQAGQVAFFDGERAELLHTYSEAEFSGEPVYPFFWLDEKAQLQLPVS
ncbi:uncharacterized protein LOC110070422 [Pogona vitticeps]